MEPDTRFFLIRIVNTISMVLIWMFSNMVLGIYNGFAFFDESPDWRNYLYYGFLLLSFVALLIYLRKKWRIGS